MKKFGLGLILLSGLFMLAGCGTTTAQTPTNSHTKKIFFVYNTPVIQSTQLKDQIIGLSVSGIDARDVNIYNLDSYTDTNSYIKGKSIEDADIYLDASSGSNQKAVLIEVSGESYNKLTLTSWVSAIDTSGPQTAVASNRAVVNLDLNKINIAKPKAVAYGSKIIYTLAAEQE